ncbi:MAG: FeoA family protein [Anaerostipes faecalis]|nr:FeoA family protein [Anaerostipes faecalis]
MDNKVTIISIENILLLVTIIKVKKIMEKRMDEMEPGEKGEIIKIDVKEDFCDRMAAVGLEEKVSVVCVGKSPWGNPSAYGVCGAVIAFRNEDVHNIKVIV